MRRLQFPTPGHAGLQFVVLTLPTWVSLVALGFATAGVVLLANEDVERGYPLLGAGLGAALLRLLWLLRGVRVRSQALHLCGGAAPRDQDEFYEALADCLAKGEAPTVVGSGWGFWTAHVAARSPVVHTYRLTGEAKNVFVPRGMMRFLAGTTIRDAERAIRRRHDRTFWSTPSIQSISLGGWFGASCHGNSGAGGKPSSYAVHRIEFYDLGPPGARYAQPRRREEPYKTARALFDEALDQYAIVAVTFNVLGTDAEGGPFMPRASAYWVQKHLCVIEVGTPELRPATDAMKKFMDDEAPLRLLFCGSSRPGFALGLKYKKWVENVDPWPHRHILGCFRVRHIDPHECSAACMSLQLDAFSMICGGWFESDAEAYNGVMPLHEANRFTPDASPEARAFYALGPAFVHCADVRNCEFVMRQRPSFGWSAADRMQHLVDALVAFCRPRWCRAEVRTSSTQEKEGILFVDMGASDAVCCAVLTTIAPYAANNQIALHTGKYQSPTLRDAIADAGLTEVRPSNIYYD